MAEMKVSEMIEAEQVNDEDLIMIVQNGVNKKVPASKVGTGQAGGDTLPIGAMMPFGSDTIPENWLLCNGQAVSRTDYQELFNTIGITYGSGDGSTTFNLPDLQGKIPVGLDENDTDFDTLGNTGGEKEHTLTINEMPNHSHMLQLRSYESASGTGQWHATYNGNESQSNVGSWETGGSQAHNNLQPYIVQNYIIKAKQSAGIVATVVDGLNSTSATDALSANQGRILNDRFNYSTTEKVVGTWIKGKPLYQKTYSGTMVNASSEAKNIINIDVDYSEIWIDLQNSFITSQNESLTLNYYFAPTDYSRAYIKKDQNAVRIKTGADLSGRNYIITLKYTKTTD